jgi:hypothetical protein
MIIPRIYTTVYVLEFLTVQRYLMNMVDMQLLCESVCYIEKYMKLVRHLVFLKKTLHILPLVNNIWQNVQCKAFPCFP